MRKGLLIGVLVLFGAWFLVKPLKFLTADRPATWQTPTVQPLDPSVLFPVRVPGGGQVCTDGMLWAPQARVVLMTVLPGKRSTPELRVEARGAGYVARGRIAPGFIDNQPVTARLTPAPREVPGTLCVRNTGRFAVSLYGVPSGGRQAAKVTTTVDGKIVPDRQLSVTLLASGSASILSRLGDVIDHVAAFRPVSPWFVWLLLIALLIGTPVAVAVALARAGALDDEADAVEHDAQPRGDPPRDDEPTAVGASSGPR